MYIVKEQQKTEKELIRMSKTLEKLIERAERTGKAILNGRKRDYQYVGPLEEKYAVIIKDNTVTLSHWGTETLKIDTVTKEVIDVYGESVSDRDSINYVLSYFNIPCHVHYFPSRYAFELHTDEKDEVMVTV